MRIDKSFERDLKKIKDKTLRYKVADILESLIEAESLDQINQIKKLKGDPISYRIKLGDYRLGLSYQENIVTVIRFLHRKDIYKYFPK